MAVHVRAMLELHRRGLTRDGERVPPQHVWAVLAPRRDLAGGPDGDLQVLEHHNQREASDELSETQRVSDFDAKSNLPSVACPHCNPP